MPALRISRDERGKAILEHLERLAAALDRLVPLPPAKADRRLRRPSCGKLPKPSCPSPTSTASSGCSKHRPRRRGEQDNTRRFARGLLANNALLWGARHGVVARQGAHASAPGAGARRRGQARSEAVEIHREDIARCPAIWPTCARRLSVSSSSATISPSTRTTPPTSR
jgi:hypothetical protein